MEIINIDQNAVIYSYDVINIPFTLGINACNNELDNIVYCSGCSIIEHNGLQYIISNRNKIIFCKKIDLYYYKSDCLYKNNLTILFQSIETNIVILGTVGNNQFKSDLSEPQNITHTNNKSISSIIISNKFDIPKSKSKYYASMNFIDGDNGEYAQNIYQFKYSKSIIHTHYYLPAIYAYEFILSKTKNNKLIDLKNICGSLLFGSDKRLIGFITEVINTKCIVLPIRHVHKIINIFFDSIAGIDTYTRSLCLPIKYKIKKNKNKIYEMIIQDYYAELNPNDKIVSVNGNEIVIWNNDSTPFVFDEIYHDYIPFDVYTRLNLNIHSMMNIVVKRRTKNVSYHIPGEKIEDNMLKISDQNDFYNNNLVPFVDLEGLIIVQFTHELLDILAWNKIELKNHIIDDFIQGIDNKKLDCLFIISKNTKKKTIPDIITIKTDQYNIINCLVLLKINNKDIYSLEEIDTLLKKRNLLSVCSSSDTNVHEFNLVRG